jgi:hypothetical protein
MFVEPFDGISGCQGLSQFACDCLPAALFFVELITVTFQSSASISYPSP